MFLRVNNIFEGKKNNYGRARKLLTFYPVNIEHEFQVDEKNKSETSKYDMIIGSDLLWQMGCDISYSRKRVEWLDDYIPLKPLNTLDDKEVCEMLYSIHADAPMLKEMEERNNRILDADYSKVNIPEMVADLDHTHKSTYARRVICSSVTYVTSKKTVVFIIIHNWTVFEKHGKSLTIEIGIYQNHQCFIIWISDRPTYIYIQQVPS